MKIILLIRSLNRGGAERQITLLAREMTARGHDVCIAVFYPGTMDDELTAAGVRLAYLGKRSRWDVLGFLNRVKAFVRDEEPDLIYSFLTVGNLISATLKLWQPSLKVVWGVRASALDVGHYDLAIKLSVKLERLLAFIPNGIISNSQAGLDALAAPKGQQCTVINNGVDITALAPDPEARQKLRRDWGVGENELLIGLVARVDPMKDHETFLATAAILLRSRPDLRFICVGDATPFDRQRLDKLAVKYGLGDLLYSPSRSDVAAVYAALDLLVLSSAFGEGSPNVIIEAAACGKPAVVTNVGASAELVRDPACVVPPRQPEALAQACLRLIASKGFGSPETAEALRQRVAQLYSLDHLTEATLQTLSDMTVTASPPLASLKNERSILFVIGSLKFGGAERHLLSIAPVLRARGWKPMIYVLSRRGDLAKNMVSSGIPILGGLSSSPWFTRFPRSLRGGLIVLDLIRVMAVLRPAICHCFLPQSCIIGGISGLVAGLRTMVMSRRSLNNYQAASPLNTWAERLMMRHGAKAVLGNSQAIIGQLDEEAIPKPKLGLIYSGMEMSGQAGPGREALRRAEGISPSALVLSIVANLHDYKGHAHLLDALGLIKNQLPEGWQLLCIGSNAGCLKDLTQQSQRLGLDGHVRFLGGRPDAAELWGLADVGLLVSLEEGFPMSLLEGMAAGLPMVVTDVGGSPEALGDCGKIVPPADPEALAEAILAYAQNPELRRQDGERARRRIEARFTLEACVDGYENLYLGLTTDDRRPVQQMIDSRA